MGHTHASTRSLSQSPRFSITISIRSRDTGRVACDTRDTRGSRVAAEHTSASTHRIRPRARATTDRRGERTKPQTVTPTLLSPHEHGGRYTPSLAGLRSIASRDINNSSPSANTRALPATREPRARSECAAGGAGADRGTGPEPSAPPSLAGARPLHRRPVPLTPPSGPAPRARHDCCRLRRYFEILSSKNALVLA